MKSNILLYSYTLTLLVLQFTHNASSLQLPCESFNTPHDGSTSYWTEVSNCSNCVQTTGCGFCLSSLMCIQGDSLGPSDGSPCPSWVSNNNDAECPQEPTCNERETCDACAAVEDCAWCASESKCMTVSDVFTKDCRGTVFDSPCPESFVGVNRVVGNLQVESDAVFGGGHLIVSGNVSATQNFRMAVDSSGFAVKSAGLVSVVAGQNEAVNSRGGDVKISAGNGINVNRGQGGHVEIFGGNGDGITAGGGGGNGGNVNLTAGNSIDKKGGNVAIASGQSVNGNGGNIKLNTAKNGQIDVVAGGGIRLHSSFTGDSGLSSPTAGAFLELVGGVDEQENPKPSYNKNIANVGSVGSIHLNAGQGLNASSPDDVAELCS